MNESPTQELQIAELQGHIERLQTTLRKVKDACEACRHEVDPARLCAAYSDLRWHEHGENLNATLYELRLNRFARLVARNVELNMENKRLKAKEKQ